MMKKVWVYKADSFEKAEKFDEEYYMSMTSSERLDTMQFLRESYLKFKKGKCDEGREGLRRVFKIIKQKQS